MAASDEAPDWAKAEIADAIRILKEDGLHIHKTFAAFQATLTNKGDGKSTETTTEETETEGNPPPTGAGNSPPKRKGVWWGERSS
jgi:hypothetical protein